MRTKEINLHGFTVEQAREELVGFLDELEEDVAEVNVVHGYKGGTALRDMIRREFNHPRVQRKLLSMNPGVTIFLVKRG